MLIANPVECIMYAHVTDTFLGRRATPTSRRRRGHQGVTAAASGASAGARSTRGGRSSTRELRAQPCPAPSPTRPSSTTGRPARGGKPGRHGGGPSPWSISRGCCLLPQVTREVEGALVFPTPGEMFFFCHTGSSEISLYREQCTGAWRLRL